LEQLKPQGTKAGRGSGGRTFENNSIHTFGLYVQESGWQPGTEWQKRVVFNSPYLSVLLTFCSVSITSLLFSNGLLPSPEATFSTGAVYF